MILRQFEQPSAAEIISKNDSGTAAKSHLLLLIMLFCGRVGRTRALKCADLQQVLETLEKETL